MRRSLALLLSATLLGACGGSLGGTDDDTGEQDSVPDVVDDTSTDSPEDSVADTSGDPIVDTYEDVPVDTHVDTHVDTAFDPGEEEPIDIMCALVVVEAETFPVNAYWAVCPGTDCEDDRSDEASDAGHLVTYEATVTAGPEGYIRRYVDLPELGSWSLWGRSVRPGNNREWSVTVDGVDSPFDLGSTVPSSWEYAGVFDVSSTSVEVVIRDVSPDDWWSYPDALIFALSPEFDPNLCSGDGAQASDCLCD